MADDAREQWVRSRMEHAFGRTVGDIDALDLDTAAAAFARELGAIDGPSTLRADAERDVARCLERRLERGESLAASLPRLDRDRAWTRLAANLGVPLPPLRVPTPGLIVGVLVMTALVVAVFRKLGISAMEFKLHFVIAGGIVFGGVQLFKAPPWPLVTTSQLVSHVLLERASVRSSGQPWTLGEVADVVVAASDLPPGGRVPDLGSGG